MDVLVKEKNIFTSVKESSTQQMMQVVNFDANVVKKGKNEVNRVACLLSGECIINCDIYPDFTLTAGKAVFLPMDCRFTLFFQQKSTFILITMDPFKKIEGYSFIEYLFNENQQQNVEKAGLLQINKIFNNYLKNLFFYIDHGLNNKALYNIKLVELFIILKRSYSIDELSSFFYPILNNDLSFASFVMDSWQDVKNVKELAELSTYCETSFNKKFKKVFGITPYKWLNEKKAGRIYYELINSDKPIKLIAEEYKFNSQQQFHDYCMRNFNQTPGSIRNK